MPNSNAAYKKRQRLNEQSAKQYWSGREKVAFATAVRHAKGGGYAPPNPTTVKKPPRDSRRACCLEMPGSGEGVNITDRDCSLIITT